VKANMKKIRYVKYVHGPTTEDFGEAQLLTCDDIDQILDRRFQMLNSTVDKLESDNQKLRADNRKLMKKCDEMSECLTDFAESKKSLTTAQSEIAKLKSRFNKLQDDCTKIFASVIDEVLSPKLELFARQIGVALPREEKAAAVSGKQRLKSVAKRKRK